MRQLMGVLAGILLVSCALAAERIGDFSLLDAKGVKHSPAEWKDAKAVVLFFLGTECPVSNGYAPEYVRLVKEYSKRGVRFYGVHPDPEVKALHAAKHAAEYHLDFSILLDPNHGLTKPVGIKVVPEAVVLSVRGEILYRGRIDDRYSSDGKRREQPASRDLDDALKAIVAGKPPPTARTKAFGCPLPAPAK